MKDLTTSQNQSENLDHDFKFFLFKVDIILIYNVGLWAQE